MQKYLVSFMALCLLIGCGNQEETPKTDSGTKTTKKKTDPRAKKLQQEALSLFGVLPGKMPGSENDTPELVALGEKLYHDKRLSENDTKSCNSCHRVDNNLAGVDNLPTSPGTEGKNGDRNSPTVYNAGFHFAQFWDGRAKDLKEQAKGPVLNPVEMAMPSEEAVVEKFSKLEEYKEPFKKAFPKEEKPITYDNIAHAIAAFERTLITRDRFDDFQKGDLTALSKDELTGLTKFIKVGCATCHKGPLMGGDAYNKTGLLNPYENTTDMGRYNETKKEEDKFLFKVPSMRNIALTAPYFHDGASATLEDAVKQIAYMQLNKKLNPIDTKYIVKFLNTLSGKDLVAGPKPESEETSKKSR
eukprot:NODE_698_length_1253_cov_65.642096_g659_i0.p1 GENE.NODE_698_length_1253_cov_65.642096_g659_i0~~NODE_698_length_1253_cov_65.642096_g659_i0.p1  ORF type:complete len:358 (-),score=43.54 NODE_698_length_1253_cov_65.642096_g659_i0:23-1096(-)